MAITVQYAEQATLGGDTKRVPVRHVFGVPFGDIRAALEASDVRCWACDKTGLVCDSPAGLQALDVFDSPWDEEPVTIYAHTRGRWDGYHESCVDAINSAHATDFHYEFCDPCGRDIIVRCPSNGWHEYFRYDEDGAICLKCYEEDIWENGLPYEKFAEARIPGMFCNPEELRDHGFAPVDGQENVCIRGEDDVQAFCDAAMALIDKGRKVAVDYESMGIGGSEGYVTLWASQTPMDVWNEAAS